MWRRLRLTVLHATYQAAAAGRLPDAGIALHEALGPALRDAACIHGESIDGPCPSPDRCAFGELFDLHSPVRTAAFLTPPSDGQVEWSPGQRLEVTLSLVGRGRLRLPWMIGALTGLGLAGLGPQRIPFPLAGLEVEGPVGHRTPVRILNAGIGQRIAELDGAEIVASRPFRDRAVLHFATPTELVRDGQRIDRPDGPTLLKRIVRRLGDLIEAHGDGPPDPAEFAAALTEAPAIECRPLDLRLVTTTRRSHSQGRTTQRLEGLVGRIELSAIPPSAWPYLTVGEWLHIGKGINFGMGKYRLE